MNNCTNSGGYEFLKWKTTPNELINMYPNAVEIKKEILFNDILFKGNFDISYEFYKNINIEIDLIIYMDQKINLKGNDNNNFFHKNMENENINTYRFFVYKDNKLFKVVVLYTIRQDIFVFVEEKLFSGLRRKYGKFNQEFNHGIYNYFSEELIIKYSKFNEPHLNKYIYVSYYNQNIEENILKIES